MSAWTDIWDVIKGVGSTAELFSSPYADANQIGDPGTAGNAIVSGGVSGAGAWGAITGFLIALTDWHLWASLGWALLGLALIFMGARLWLGKSALPAPPIPIPV